MIAYAALGLGPLVRQQSLVVQSGVGGLVLADAYLELVGHQVHGCAHALYLDVQQPPHLPLGLALQILGA